MRLKLYTFIVFVFIAGVITLSLHAAPEKKPWMNNVGSAPSITPPLERELEPEEIVRFTVSSDNALQIFTGPGVHMYAFKKGEPVFKLDHGMGKYKICITTHEADSIVLYNTDGQPSKIDVAAGKMNEKDVAAGEKITFTGITKGENVLARFVNITSGESSFVYSWFTNGRELSDSEIGPKSFRTTTLAGPGAAKQVEWVSPGDVLQVEGVTGEVRVKAGQPFN
jgi:hypothetical protein